MIHLEMAVITEVRSFITLAQGGIKWPKSGKGRDIFLG